MKKWEFSCLNCPNLSFICLHLFFAFHVVRYNNHRYFYSKLLYDDNIRRQWNQIDLLALVKLQIPLEFSFSPIQTLKIKSTEVFNGGREMWRMYHFGMRVRIILPICELIASKGRTTIGINVKLFGGISQQ